MLLHFCGILMSRYYIFFSCNHFSLFSLCLSARMDKKIIEIKESAMESERPVECGIKKKKKEKRCRVPPIRGRVKRKIFALLLKKLKLASLYFIRHHLISNSNNS
ncbi:Uncharacterized protein TCM_035281 [Theobroma cacao]|uniref:Uncharacterized protein n=1 Tax=Theobroma cacao TaxID=3641 RepID=A0A061FGM2_THECC|nr:Uncharacterized protein TCM_035281 [Theobroma cacao]